MSNDNGVRNVSPAPSPGYEGTRETIVALERNGIDYRNTAVETGLMIDRFHPKRLHVYVTEIIEESGSAKTFRIIPEEGYLPPFQAGQYVNLFASIGDVETSRPYAISSSPTERGYYDLTIKRVKGGFVSGFLLDHIQPGDRLETTGPMGSFFYNPVFHGREVVFLAGGSGVTPALSMIREVTSRGLDLRFHLILGSRSLNDVLFRDLLDDAAIRHENIRVSHVISEPPEGYTGLTGFITGERIKELAGPIGTQMFYICGPQVMHDFCHDELKRLGVKERRIRIEANGAPGQPTARPGWPEGVGPETQVEVTVRGGGSFKVLTTEPLLNSLERNGVRPEAACRSGECSMCRVKLISGRVFEPSEARVRRSDRHFGFIHSCVSYPVEDIEILI